MRCELRRSYRFEAARKLTGIAAEHPCASVHGHSFEVELTVDGIVDERAGWVMDFGAVDDVVGPFVETLDHSMLNDIEGLENPTSEHIAAWLWQRIASAVPGLVAIRVSETPTSAVIYRGG